MRQKRSQSVQKSIPSREAEISDFGIAALGRNGWFSRRKAAKKIKRLQHYSRCERRQQRNRTHKRGPTAAIEGERPQRRRQPGFFA
jgi:hypothetical protein